ncbi:MAG: inositol monophosphatase family protein [Gemmataceae bacterium]
MRGLCPQSIGELMNPDWKNRYDFAIEITQRAGNEARKIYDSTFTVEWKEDRSPVTVADRNAEKLIREAVAKSFPGDGFLGEEYGDQPGTTGYRWIIDPVDGTKSFVRKVPMWGTLVGLEYQDESIAGVVYMPNYGELWHALRGHGAYHHERRIRVSDVSDLSRSMITYSSINWFEKNGCKDQFLELMTKTDRQRGYGDFYGFCLVAQGSCEIMIDHGVHAWDVAAVKPIVEEAGGRFTNWSGTPTIHSPDVIATNGQVHKAVLEIVNRKN